MMFSAKKKCLQDKQLKSFLFFRQSYDIGKTNVKYGPEKDALVSLYSTDLR